MGRRRRVKLVVMARTFVLIIGLAASVFTGRVFAAAPAVVTAAGDIAQCVGIPAARSGAERTARLIEKFPGIVLALGDLAYGDGLQSEYEACYEPTWGRFKARTNPVPGNHDYLDPKLYYHRYFGARVGAFGKGFYSFDYGDWHFIALNSNLKPPASLEQLAWVRADLAANTRLCTLAYWHHPRFSSGDHGNDPRLRDLWALLDTEGVDIVLSGHDHDYERLAPQDADGNADAHGIRSFVVGTGGAALRPFARILPTSEYRDATSLGVLKLELYNDRYVWEFITANGASRDRGSAQCYR